MRLPLLVLLAAFVVSAAALSSSSSSSSSRHSRARVSTIRHRQYVARQQERERQRQQQQQRHAETSETKIDTALLLEGYLEAQDYACSVGSRFCEHYLQEPSLLETDSAAQEKIVYDTVDDAIVAIKAKLGKADSSTTRFLTGMNTNRPANRPNAVNVAVIGAGPGGMFAAMHAWSYGAARVIVLDKRAPIAAYELDQLVAGGVLPEETNLKELRSVKWYDWLLAPIRSLNQAKFEDVSLRHVGIYLNAAARVLAGPDTADTPFIANANQIEIHLGHAFLAWCPPTLARTNYRLISMLNAPDDLISRGPLLPAQREYCAVMDVVNPGARDWAIEAGQHLAIVGDGNLAARLRLNAHSGFVFNNIHVLSIADGARSRIRAAFFGGDDGTGNVLRALWPLNNVRSVRDNDVPLHRDHVVNWGTEAFLYDISLMFVVDWRSGKYPTTDLWGQIWREKGFSGRFNNYWAQTTIPANRKISCGSVFQRQFIPSVIGADLIDYVGHALKPTWITENQTPWSSANPVNWNYRDLFGSININLDLYDADIGLALNHLTGVQTMRALGMTSLFSRRGPNLCTFSMRLERISPENDWGARWQAVARLPNNDAPAGGRRTINQFWQAIAEGIGNAAFSDELVYDRVAVPARKARSVFESLIAVALDRAVVQNTAGHRAIVSVEGDAEMPAYFVTGKGIESAYERTKSFGVMVQGIVANDVYDAATKSASTLLYAYHQACKYLSEMCYYKSGAPRLDIVVARRMYAEPARDAACTPEIDDACQCAAQAAFDTDFFQHQDRTY